MLKINKLNNKKDNFVKRIKKSHLLSQSVKQCHLLQMLFRVRFHRNCLWA